MAAINILVWFLWAFVCVCVCVCKLEAYICFMACFFSPHHVIFHSLLQSLHSWPWMATYLATRGLTLPTVSSALAVTPWKTRTGFSKRNREPGTTPLPSLPTPPPQGSLCFWANYAWWWAWVQEWVCLGSNPIWASFLYVILVKVTIFVSHLPHL
jgi:hypothetical protein